ncbi:MAG: TonB family protein [Pseudarcicella sp.]|nr:TonB family protein [Pseudarcicella sp.]MBP6409816.1 TonB family protein [Pseudarcicella sp.]
MKIVIVIVMFLGVATNIVASNDKSFSNSKNKFEHNHLASTDYSLASDSTKNSSDEDIDEIERLLQKAKSELQSINSKNTKSQNKAAESVDFTPKEQLKTTPKPIENAVPEYREQVLSEEEKLVYGNNQFTQLLDDGVDKSDSIYVMPEILAEYAGGLEEMKAYFTKNLKVPSNVNTEDINGKVYLKFIVRKNGSIEKVHILKGSNETLNFEALRVVKAMPAWTPAKQDGTNVSSQVVLPVGFK